MNSPSVLRQIMFFVLNLGIGLVILALVVIGHLGALILLRELSERVLELASSQSPALTIVLSLACLIVMFKILLSLLDMMENPPIWRIG